MGRGIATRLVSGGHNVTIMDRQPDKAKSLAEQIAVNAKKGVMVQGVAFGSPINDEIVILAIPYSATSEVIEKYGAQFTGKTIIDITNPLNATYDGLAVAPGTSAAEEIAKKLPANAKVFKAFNTTFAMTLVAGQVDNKPLDVFIAGNDAAAKAQVLQLVKDSGLRAIDAGPLERARQLEALGLLGITLQGTLGTGYKSAWKIVS
jgi:8-hydroxy-5-deazaflavin:NADPH oxidoreductase